MANCKVNLKLTWNTNCKSCVTSEASYCHLLLTTDRQATRQSAITCRPQLSNAVPWPSDTPDMSKRLGLFYYCDNIEGRYRQGIPNTAGKRVDGRSGLIWSASLPSWGPEGRPDLPNRLVYLTAFKWVSRDYRFIKHVHSRPFNEPNFIHINVAICK